MDYYSPTTGAFDSGAGPHAWAMLEVAALSQTVPATATSYLKELQQPNGGWEWFPGWGSDTNSTALAIQALASANQPLTSTTIISALAFLDTAQNSDGGFPYDPNSPWDTSSDVNSTANVVQALIATGQDPLSSRWTISSATPVSYLLGMQLSDGSLEWQPGLGSDTMATAQAVPALLGRPFPYRPVELNACRVAYLPLVARP